MRSEWWRWNLACSDAGTGVVGKLFGAFGSRSMMYLMRPCESANEFFPALAADTTGALTPGAANAEDEIEINRHAIKVRKCSPLSVS